MDLLPKERICYIVVYFVTLLSMLSISLNCIYPARPLPLVGAKHQIEPHRLGELLPGDTLNLLLLRCPGDREPRVPPTAGLVTEGKVLLQGWGLGNPS